MRHLHTIVCTGIALFLAPVSVAAESSQSAAARPASVSEISIPLSDARNIGANSVRFSAAQFTREAPTVVLFGADTESWHRIRSGLRQAVAEGYPVAGIFIGPIDESPTMEVYAKGHHVTNPIDPRTISEAEVTKLIRDVVMEYYR